MYYERFIHICQEVVLFLANLIQLFFAQRPDLVI